MTDWYQHIQAEEASENLLRFPRQRFTGEPVEVTLNGDDPNDSFMGQLVRDDADDPHVTIIKLDDGRYVLGTECEWSRLGGA